MNAEDLSYYSDRDLLVQIVLLLDSIESELLLANEKLQRISTSLRLPARPTGETV